MPPLQVYELVTRGELKKFPNNYLDKEAIKEIIRYVILVVNKYSRKDILSKVDHKFFMDNFLGGARKFFDKSNTYMLIYCFPEWDLHAWEFKNVPPGFWEIVKNRREFVIWIANRIGVDPYTKEGLREITAAIVNKYGGSKPLVYAGGLYELLNTVIPGKYKKWEITKIVSWTEEEAVIATKWLVEEKLKYTSEQVCKIKVSDFTANHLDGMLQKKYNHSILNALEAAYPGRYCRTKARGICLKK